MRESYKISEIAKIFNISRRTLIYYDEIDLFKPYYIDEENGYRYYSEHQTYVLRFIIALKNSGFSLNEIKKYTNFKSIEESQEFLESKIEAMKEKIKNLEKSIEIVKIKYDQLEKVKSSEGLKPGIVTDINFKMIIIDVKKPYGYVQTEKAFKELSQIEKNLQLKEKKHVAIVGMKNLKKLNVYPLKFVGSVIPDELEHSAAINVEEKKCATITHKDSFENLKNSYKKLMDFIEDNSYKIIGNSLEISSEEKIQLEGGIGEVIEIIIPVKQVL
ncbi:MerR family transcriptional regulator [Ilyobacter polytropus]|uniref:Transcriptional regulator, MerR family n=1 Tax=Ilyobacter polytropus (strain ATCC 51220 / DSM 2926 / LMG 16218 / CuHBu1) TaxID=572544 RepID=E3H9J7_ILYPC|nr:MerR family transcriptional regulator [Ilyobacter polytropus]ADO83386.1 transcriptional regulator, MerR family [Ilyobacter polytropus DSM 2926]